MIGKVNPGLQAFAAEGQYYFQSKVLKKGRGEWFLHKNSALGSFCPSSGMLLISNPMGSPLHMAGRERKQCHSNAFMLTACPCLSLLPTWWHLGEIQSLHDIGPETRSGTGKGCSSCLQGSRTVSWWKRSVELYITEGVQQTMHNTWRICFYSRKINLQKYAVLQQIFM